MAFFVIFILHPQRRVRAITQVTQPPPKIAEFDTWYFQNVEDPDEKRWIFLPFPPMPLGPRHPFDLLSSILLVKLGTSSWSVGMQSCFSQHLAGMINLTRSHEVICEKLSLCFHLFSKEGSRRSRPQLGIGSLIISSFQGPAGSFSFLPSTFPLLNAIKLHDTSSCCSLELDFGVGGGGRVLA